MRVLVLADLHHDFWADTPADRARLDAGRAAMGPVDAAILAGDMSNKARTRWKEAAAWLDPVVPRAHTYVFPGNHDYYAHRLDGDGRLEAFAQACGWVWAQQQAVVLGGVRFLCATLWTDLCLDRPAIENGPVLAARMNDYRYIRVEKGGFRKARPEDTARVHQAHLAWISGMLDTPFDGPTAVVTHHAPHPDALVLRDRVLDAAYASDLSTFLRLHKGEGTRVWYHGHAHGARPVDLPGWHIRPHSLGYPFETHHDPNPSRVLPACVVDTDRLHALWNA